MPQEVSFAFMLDYCRLWVNVYCANTTITSHKSSRRLVPVLLTACLLVPKLWYEAATDINWHWCWQFCQGKAMWQNRRICRPFYNIRTMMVIMVLLNSHICFRLCNPGYCWSWLFSFSNIPKKIWSVDLSDFLYCYRWAGQSGNITALYSGTFFH